MQKTRDGQTNSPWHYYGKYKENSMENMNAHVMVSTFNFSSEYRMCPQFSIKMLKFQQSVIFQQRLFLTRSISFLGKALSMYIGATMSNYRTQIVFNHTEDFCESTLMIIVVLWVLSSKCWRRSNEREREAYYREGNMRKRGSSGRGTY